MRAVKARVVTKRNVDVQYSRCTRRTSRMSRSASSACTTMIFSTIWFTDRTSRPSRTASTISATMMCNIYGVLDVNACAVSIHGDEVQYISVYSALLVTVMVRVVSKHNDHVRYIWRARRNLLLDAGQAEPLVVGDMMLEIAGLLMCNLISPHC